MQVWFDLKRECGEAFFEVAENKRVPFVVKTDAYEITVLGPMLCLQGVPDVPREPPDEAGIMRKFKK